MGAMTTDFPGLLRKKFLRSSSLSITTFALHFRVFCLGCGDQTLRTELQEHFEALNPTWKAEALGVAPDGDVFLTDEQVRNFQVPACSKCGGILKPDVTFFGDTVSREKVDFVHQRLAESDSMLVAGSSMQVRRSSSHTVFLFLCYSAGNKFLVPQIRAPVCSHHSHFRAS